MKDIKLLRIPDVYSAKKIICVQPHHDDNDIGAGALICDLVNKKTKIIYVTVTDGSLGIKDENLSDLQKVEIRKKEQFESGKISGVSEFIDLGYKDQGTYSVEDLEKQLLNIFNKEKPDMVMGPDPFLEYESHTDHIKTGKALLQTSFKCGLGGYPADPEDLNPKALNGVILYYTSKPNRFFDAQENWNKKKRMIGMFKSQFDDEYLADIFEYMDYKAKEHAKTQGMKLAEGFKVLSIHALHCIN